MTEDDNVIIGVSVQWILRDGDRPCSRRIAETLVSFGGFDDRGRQTRETGTREIAEHLGISKRAVRMAIKACRDRGWLEGKNPNMVVRIPLVDEPRQGKTITRNGKEYRLHGDDLIKVLGYGQFRNREYASIREPDGITPQQAMEIYRSDLVREELKPIYLLAIEAANEKTGKRVLLSHTFLHDKLGVSNRKAMRLLRDLEDEGLIRATHYVRLKPNTRPTLAYELVCPPNWTVKEYVTDSLLRFSLVRIIGLERDYSLRGDKFQSVLDETQALLEDEGFTVRVGGNTTPEGGSITPLSGSIDSVPKGNLKIVV